MGPCPRSVRWLVVCCLLIPPLLGEGAEVGPPAAATTPTSPSRASETATTQLPGSPERIVITADRTEYLQANEVYEAHGHVVVEHGVRRLTADDATLFMLTGTLVATGHVHLTDASTETRAERLELNVNTEMGVIVNGQVYLRESNTLVTGRLMQRFSEAHYRVKEGSFTNCDAAGDQVPAWRFRFADVDLNMGEEVYLKDVWFCVNDYPILKLPTWSYPISTRRKTGLLIPTIGYDNRFGMHYRQSIFWAISPHQDLLVSPDILTNRGYGGDVQYRYVLDRRSRGYWFTSFIQDTEVNQARGLLSGSHRQQVTPDLTVNAHVFLLSDPNYLNQLSNSGVQRALPSGESLLDVRQRLGNGNLYLLGQYLQPLSAGGPTTFQRLPEIGYRMTPTAPLGGPLLLETDATFVNFYRERGFGFDRVDVVPGLTTDVLDLGHVVGLRPHVRLRETYYTRSLDSVRSTHRQTFWAALEATSRMSRRYSRADGQSLLHTLEPSVIYEYVPDTPQAHLIQVDDVDFLPKKNLITYALRTRLLEHGPAGNHNWLDLMVAQSYHPGSTPNLARRFVFPGDPLFGVATQPGTITLEPIQLNKFSDIWTRAVLGNPVGYIRGIDHTLTLDAFYDPYQGSFSQLNTDLRFQQERRWYVEAGQRYTGAGNRPRRGDIWNPISFNEEFAPTPSIKFLTAAVGFRAPLGWTLGARTYYDYEHGRSPETDVVALYRNPCQCWSLGLYYIQFPDRVQYNFMITLTGVGATENFGTQLMKYLLEPLLIGERALPWPSRLGRRPEDTARAASPAGPMLQ